MGSYLDHAATTPVRESALQAWVEATRALQESPGNSSAIHGGGRKAKRMLQDARAALADALGADRAEVLFTSGATESVALGVTGAALAKMRRDPKRSRVVTSGVEHPSVAKQKDSPAGQLLQWTTLPTTFQGLTVVDEDLFPADTALATITQVCSETGVLQPVEELVRIGQAAGFWTHSDATQAVGNVPVSFQESGLDLMSLGGHKFGAPVGTGALLVSRAADIATDRPGGGQERQLRSGTPDVAGAVALSVAATEAVEQLKERTLRHGKLRDQLLAGLPEGVHPTQLATSVPSIVHLSVPTTHPEALLMELDRHGVLASAGSACHAGVTRPSEVLLATGRSEAESLGVLRVSFGYNTSPKDVDAFLSALPFAVQAAKQLDALDKRRGG